MFQRILLAYDGSEASTRALARAAELARAARAELHLLAVGRVPEYAETQDEVDEAQEQAQAFYGKRLEEAAGTLTARDLDAVAHLAFGKPSEQIVRLSRELSADLIVLGAHPHHPLRRRLLGATADKVVDSAECSVLVVR
jgi:nucleotide-binding universal stress UspA family protein